MRSPVGQPVRLVDYRVPDFLVDRVEMDISLDAQATRVVAELSLRPNPLGPGRRAVAARRRRTVAAERRTRRRRRSPRAPSLRAPDELTLAAPPRRPFKLKIETRLAPAANTKLMGLYRSGTAYCTQCEAEGFRRITYFLDRPDVLSVYRVRMEADKAEAPVLLANGNLGIAGRGGAGRHYAVWFDPFPKPCYLFALVAGDLAKLADHFVTASGRRVELGVYTEPGRQARAAYAMDALKRSMAWDETAYGREYDLDVFNIVAVSDFNMGAMENKGLNVFNDKYVLASAETATDDDYAGIEGVIAHEYFHNWTGNRITCRDWFQLCLKEGLTVFRDQDFSADQRSRAGQAHRRRARSESRAIPRGRRAARAQRAPGGLSRDQQLLHGDRLSEGRGSDPHAEDADWRRRVQGGHGPLFRTLRRHGGDGRRRSSAVSPTSPAGTSRYSSAGTRRPGRRICASPRPTNRRRRPTASNSCSRWRPTPGQTDKLPMTIPVRLGLVDGEAGDLKLESATTRARMNWKPACSRSRPRAAR